nr:hypothetical protein [uncultured Holophaga sp.]
MSFDGTAALQLPEQDPTAEALKSETSTLLEQARSVRVTTPDEYRTAGLFFSSIKAKIKEVDVERRKRVDPLNQTVKIINADYKGISEQLEQVLKVIEAPMLAFKREEERQRREAEEAARRERERLEAEARQRAREEERRLEEIRQREAEARKDAEQATNPVAAFLAQEKAAAADREAQAAVENVKDAYREAATVDQVVPVIAPVKATAAGTSFRKAWKAEVVDADLIPREYLIPDLQLLGQIAREQKELASIPGVRFFAVESIGGR